MKIFSFVYLVHTLILFSVVPSYFAVETEPLHSKFLGKSMSGEWNIQKADKEHIKIFGIPQNWTVLAKAKDYNITFFNATNGQAEGQFYLQQDSNDEGLNTTHFFIRLYQDKYITDNVIQFRFPLKVSPNYAIHNKNSKNQKQKQQGYIEQQNKWRINQFYTSVNLYRNLEYLVTFDIELSIEVKAQKDPQNKFSDEEVLQVNLNSNSIKANLILRQPKYSYKYFLSLTVINCLQILLLLAFKRNRNILFGTSQWLIIHTIFFLMFQWFILIKISMNKFDTALSFLLINSLLNILVVFLILRKFEKVFQKFTNKRWLALVCVFLIIYITFASFNFYIPQFWLFESMTFLWQIIHSMINGGVGGVAIDLVFVILLSRIPVFYLLSTDGNIMRISPNSHVGFMILSFTIVHLAFIVAQRKFGSRLLVPKWMIPDYHNYIRWAYYQSHQAQEICSICLNKLRQKPEELNKNQEDNDEGDSEENNEGEAHSEQNVVPNLKNQDEKSEQQTSQKIQSEKDRKIEYVQTPCKHAYHKKCLGDWLQTNLVCPMCKRTLPSMSQNV